MLHVRFWFVIALAMVLGCAAGCKKSRQEGSEQTAPVADQSAPPADKAAPVVDNKPPPPLRGAGDVTAALQRKDYPAAVAALAQIKANITLDQRLQYNELMGKVKEAISQARATDESARRAFDALRQIESGR